MSLINRMLQDLETRRAPLDSGHGLGQEVRALPPQARSPVSALLLIVMVCALLAAGAAWWWLKSSPTASTPAPVLLPVPLAAPVADAPPTPIATAPVTSSAATDPVPAGTPASPSTAAEANPAPPAPNETPAPAPAPSAKQEQKPAAASIAAASGESRLGPAGETARPLPQNAKKDAQEAAKTQPKSGKPDNDLHLKASPLLKARTAQPDAATPDQGAPDDAGRIEKKPHPGTARERAENEYRRALGLVNQGRIQEAASALRSALAEDPGHAASRLALFGLLIEQQRLDDAQALLQEALARDAAQPQFASRLARLQMQRGNPKGAEETLAKAAPAASGNAEYRALHAAVLQRLTLHKEAVAQYQAALRLVPQAGVWWMGLGISLEAEGRTAEAREAFERARASGMLSAELDAFVERKLKSLQ